MRGDNSPSEHASYEELVRIIKKHRDGKKNLSSQELEEFEKLSLYRCELLESSSHEDRIAVLNQLLQKAQRGLQHPLKLDAMEQGTAPYFIAGWLLQEECRSLVPTEGTGAIRADSLLHTDRWRSCLTALDQTLCTLKSLGLKSEELHPNRIRWNAKSGFVDIAAPNRKLIIEPAKNARWSIHGISPGWDHERDRGESRRYFAAQLAAIKRGADIERVFVYELEDDEAEESPNEAQKKALKRTAVARAEKQRSDINRAREKDPEASAEWGTFTPYVLDERTILADEINPIAALPVALRGLALPSMAVYDSAEPEAICAVIDRVNPGSYMMSAVQSDAKALYDFFLTVRGLSEELT
jgi:hypothetical protein